MMVQDIQLAVLHPTGHTAGCPTSYRTYSWLSYILQDIQLAVLHPTSNSLYHNNYYYYLLQLSCHSVAVVLTPVQTKQIRINIHKRNNTKQSTNNTKHSKYKYTYYQNTHTIQIRVA
jgi:hypothetical protein